ncbi:unnamed protein product [Amoebophrya sp. A120]|nr:unnamed protein product [Amoebophrya sp. A120]|eukprot:GSA120T00015443001.1
MMAATPPFLPAVPAAACSSLLAPPRPRRQSIMEKVGGGHQVYSQSNLPVQVQQHQLPGYPIITSTGNFVATSCSSRPTSQRSILQRSQLSSHSNLEAVLEGGADDPFAAPRIDSAASSVPINISAENKTSVGLVHEDRPSSTVTNAAAGATTRQSAVHIKPPAVSTQLRGTTTTSSTASTTLAGGSTQHEINRDAETSRSEALQQRTLLLLQRRQSSMGMQILQNASSNQGAASAAASNLAPSGSGVINHVAGQTAPKMNNTLFHQRRASTAAALVVPRAAILNAANAGCMGTTPNVNRRASSTGLIQQHMIMAPSTTTSRGAPGAPTSIVKPVLSQSRPDVVGEGAILFQGRRASSTSGYIFSGGRRPAAGPGCSGATSSSCGEAREELRDVDNKNYALAPKSGTTIAAEDEDEDKMTSRSKNHVSERGRKPTSTLVSSQRHSLAATGRSSCRGTSRRGSLTPVIVNGDASSSCNSPVLVGGTGTAAGGPVLLTEAAALEQEDAPKLYDNYPAHVDTHASATASPVGLHPELLAQMQNQPKDRVSKLSELVGAAAAKNSAVKDPRTSTKEGGTTVRRAVEEEDLTSRGDETGNDTTSDEELLHHGCEAVVEQEQMVAQVGGRNYQSQIIDLDQKMKSYGKNQSELLSCEVVDNALQQQRQEQSRLQLEVEQHNFHRVDRSHQEFDFSSQNEFDVVESAALEGADDNSTEEAIAVTYEVYVEIQEKIILVVSKFRTFETDYNIFQCGLMTFVVGFLVNFVFFEMSILGPAEDEDAEGSRDSAACEQVVPLYGILLLFNLVLFLDILWLKEMAGIYESFLIERVQTTCLDSIAKLSVYLFNDAQALNLNLATQQHSMCIRLFGQPITYALLWKAVSLVVLNLMMTLMVPLLLSNRS